MLVSGIVLLKIAFSKIKYWLKTLQNFLIEKVSLFLHIMEEKEVTFFVIEINIELISNIQND